MREIKFRLWDVWSKQMRTDDLSMRMSIDDNGELNSMNAMSQKNIVMQFTGLFDKSGTPIYEGDIVQEDGVKGTVIFQAGAFMIDWEMEDVLVDPVGFDSQNRSRDLEILGNIYQHPHLLNK